MSLRCKDLAVTIPSSFCGQATATIPDFCGTASAGDFCPTASAGEISEPRMPALERALREELRRAVGK